VQSIQRQVDELADIIDHNGLRIHGELLRESRSAFSPGREEFAKMVRWTYEGRVNAWLCWHANRLSRNPVDAGTIVYLMDQGKLHHIRTRERIYYDTPTDKFMLQMEFTMSKKDSDDKSTLVKSGLLRRHRRGYPNGFPPAGYVQRSEGSSGHSFWVVDRPRFNKVRKVLQRFLQGHDSITSITAYARRIGLTTTPKSRVGGRPLTRSAIHVRLLVNPIYAGYFSGIDGRRYELDRSLPRVLAEEDFARIQEILGSRRVSKSRQQRDAAYSGLLRGAGGEYVGADFKFQMICDCRLKFAYLSRDRCPRCGERIIALQNPTYLKYTYYSVVADRKKTIRNAPSIEEKRVDAYIIEKVARPMAISRELRDWAVRYLKELHDEELRDRRKEARRVRDREAEYKRKRSRLRELLVKELISEEEYLSDMRDVDEARALAAEGRFELREDWLADATDMLNLAVEMENVLLYGTPSAKRQAIKRTCSNLTWDGEKLLLDTTKQANSLISALYAAKAKNPRFEPENCVDTKGSNASFKEVRPLLLRGVDGVRTYGGHQSTGYTQRG